MASASELMARAARATGLDDFGAPGCRDGLERSLDAFARVPLTQQARGEVLAKIEQELATRLRIEDWYARHPETADHKVEEPVFVVGMPRTGTTAMVAMLALDEANFRFLRGWEATTPVPPPVSGQEETDPRRLASLEFAKNYQLSHLHLFDPDGPEEDLAFLAGLDMHAYHGAYPMPDDYIEWWQKTDFSSTYAYLARVFQLLHSQRPPRRWLLKSPPHLYRLDAIIRQFPDARFVMTHRDPAKLIASVASLHHSLHEARCLPGTQDKVAIGKRHLAFWIEGLRRGLEARERIGEDRFIDVRNDDVVKEPVATFERVYDWLGIPLDAELGEKLRAYNSRNAPGKFGAHRYTAEEYGLSEDMIREAFADYIDRFELH